MNILIGNIIIILGFVFILFGEFSLFRYPKFHSRVPICSLIDTCGFMTVCIGVIIRQGISYFSLKVLLILLIMLIINPISTHAVANSADLSKYKIGKGEFD